MALKGAKFGQSINAELFRYLGVPKWILSVSIVALISKQCHALRQRCSRCTDKKTATFEINFVHYAK